MVVTGEAVKALRLRMGWSTYDLALQIGCNQSTVWRIENGANFSPVMGRVLERILRKHQAAAKKVSA